MWRLSATINGTPTTWEGVDRFTLKGDLAVEGIAYFDTLPVWALLDASMRRGHGELLDALAAAASRDANRATPMA
ncbi:MAG: hypothetical protein ACREQJ_01675 [Candidatus Binatia bacterium]